MSSKNTNKINVPEARAAMDKFKMEAGEGRTELIGRFFPAGTPARKIEPL